MRKKFKMWLFRVLFPSQYVYCMSDNTDTTKKILELQEENLELLKLNKDILSEKVQLIKICTSDVKSMRKILDIIEKDNKISYKSLKAINDIFDEAIKYNNDVLKNK